MKIVQAAVFVIAFFVSQTPEISFAEVAPSPACIIFRVDMADRDAKNPKLNGAKIDWPAVRARDAERRINMQKLLDGGAVNNSKDYYCAAVVFQHGDNEEDIQLAHALAVVSAKLNPHLKNTRYMVAATWDRYMVMRKRPQWYGTQYVRGNDNRWVLHPVDESAVDDDARRKLAVPTLAEARAEVAQLNSKP
jgi:hypothetical protein